MKIMFACDVCHFLFEAVQMIDQCPDCGKYMVRPATQEEHDEYEKRKEEAYDE